ncbi:DUF5707 domain-containing protein [Streptomyces sporangiiformans]|uniref:Calcium-binding protein n=1 Tax=Streptomyces sporangiiformans TaxID=2315329 RepID=A0A505DBF1_9ACTN|nr:DUF5707 domain-containing protein [Streptomyces sporangiiformans]TPQ21084.1 hypothetical protein FGD71_017025 [Streptomyces sporangiiformans]
MSKRIIVSSLIGFAVIGGVAAGGLAVASAATELTVENSSARYVAPSGGKAGSITFTADVSDDSGIRGLKVLAWPASSKLDPTEAELRSVDSATCRSTSDDTFRCTYTAKVTKAETAGLAEGTWYVSALATAKDGDTKFVPRAATFDVTR